MLICIVVFFKALDCHAIDEPVNDRQNKYGSIKNERAEASARWTPGNQF